MVTGNTITLTTTFMNGNTTMYAQKCDYPLQKHMLDITSCPVIKDILSSSVSHSVDIGVPDIHLTIHSRPNDILPKILATGQDMCKMCKHKHLENEAQIKR